MAVAGVGAVKGEKADTVGDNTATKMKNTGTEGNDTRIETDKR